MALEPHIAVKPSDFDDLVALIAKSHEARGNSEIQELALQGCLNYLRENGTNAHLFCDQYIFPISVHTLILFSFPNNKLIDWLTPLMSNCMTQCTACVAGFVQGRNQLFQEFAVERKIPVHQVRQVIEVIVDWQSSIIENSFEEWANKVAEARQEDIHDLVMISLLDSELSRSSPNIKANITVLLKHYIKMGFSLKLDQITSGAVYFLFEGDDEIRAWVAALIQDVPKITKNSSYSAVLGEFTTYLYQIQNEKYYNDQFCSRFWENAHKIYRCVDTECFMDHFNTPESISIMSQFDNICYFPLVRVLLNQLRANIDAPLQNALVMLSSLLADLGNKFWTYSSPFSFANTLDFILGSKTYLNLCTSTPDLASLVQWQVPFLNSLIDSAKGTFVVKVSSFYFSSISNPQNTNKDQMISQAVNGLLSSFDEKSLDLDNKSLDLYILSRRDVRAILDNHAATLVSWQFENRDPTMSVALAQLIKLAALYDTSILAFNSLQLQNEIKPKVYDAFPLLWQELSKQKTFSQDLVEKLMESLKFIGSAVVFLPRKSSTVESTLAESRKKHNEQVTLISEPIGEIIERISTSDTIDFQKLFSKEECSRGFFSCVFSSLVSQQVLDIVYQTYDVAGRYEGLQALLKANLKTSFMSVNIGLKNLTKLAAFEPSPRAVRLCMDIVKVFTDPIDGVSMEDASAKEQVQEFWTIVWQFLVMVYKKTLIWASMYHLNDLIEFTRDTLDLSHLLLDSFRLLVDYVGTDGVASKLLKVFVDAFYFVIVWLRLGDVSLLNSCVDLVFKGFDLAQTYNVSVDPAFLTLFVKYGAKAKKFNNKLSPQQRKEILAKARELDYSLVEEILVEVAAANDANQKKIKVEPKQQTLGRFGVTTKTPPVAPPPPQKEFKSSALENIRKELQEKRGGAPLNPNHAPAQARPAGFNRRPVVVGRSLNQLKKRSTESESSEDENESDVDTSDLFIDKKKKAKVVEIDMYGRPVTKTIQRKSINKERQEEERMRLRLSVSMNGLYERILKWNYSSSNTFPDANSQPPEPTKDSYDSIKDYIRIIEPLLMLECWESIQQSKNSGDDVPFELYVGRRLSCDGFFELNCTISKAILQTIKLGDSDLIALSHIEGSAPMSKQQLRSHMTSKETLTCLAKVVSLKSANAESMDLTLRVSPQGGMLGFLTPKSVLVGMKVIQMITIEREYSSLKGLQYYDLCDDVLTAKPSESMSDSIPEPKINSIMKSYNANKSQATAIATTANALGFSLIQGPPGTGKTKTILGIIGFNLKAQKEIGTVNTATDVKLNEESRILVCAPSNAAVDELVLRIRNGVKNANGETIIPKVVRLGRSDAANAAVKDLTLEELVESQISAKQQNGPDQTLREEHSKLTQQRNKLNDDRKKPDIDGKTLEKIENQLREINKKRHALAQRLDSEREKASIAYRTREIEKRQLQQKILNEAQIICSTLSASAHDFLSSMSLTFKKVIIDEACQCVELSALIPLRYGCQQCVMVGDPNQLPPTILSMYNQKTNYEQSLFVRIQKQNPNAVHLLDVQYRMHPQISQFPSKEFYQGKLKDGPGMELETARKWHSFYPLTPYRVFDIPSRHAQNNKTMSFFNTTEARIALELVSFVKSFIPIEDFRGMIGLISPYKEQVRTLRDMFVREFGSTILKEIDFNTVDGYQGQEKDIIIMSCVRASESGGVGFLGDIRRMNVGLTRAKTSLWVLGNVESLRRNTRWDHLLTNAKNRDLVTRAYPGFLNTIGKEITGGPPPQPPQPVIEIAPHVPAQEQNITPPVEASRAPVEAPQSQAVPQKPKQQTPQFSSATNSPIPTEPKLHRTGYLNPRKRDNGPPKGPSAKKHRVYIHQPNAANPPKGPEQNQNAVQPEQGTAAPGAQNPAPGPTPNPAPSSGAQVTKSGTLPPRHKKPSSVFISRRKPPY